MTFFSCVLFLLAVPLCAVSSRGYVIFFFHFLELQFKCLIEKPKWKKYLWPSIDLPNLGATALVVVGIDFHFIDLPPALGKHSYALIISDNVLIDSALQSGESYVCVWL